MKPFAGYSDRKGGKSGGIHESDPEGGIYQSLDGRDNFLIKRDINKEQNDIGEFLTSQIFAATAPGSGCAVTLMRSNDTQKTFLASKFYKDDYQDFFKALGKKRRSAGLETRQAIMGTQYVTAGLRSKDSKGQYKYSNYEKMIVTSLLVGDYSVHSGNIGVIKKDGQEELVRIDFGAAFRDIGADINPYKPMKNRLGFEKNYFLRDHPKQRIFSKEFSAELKRVASIDLKDVISNAFKDIDTYYDAKTITKFGLQIGMTKADFLDRQSKPVNKVISHVTSIMEKRAHSLRDLATEVDLQILIQDQRKTQSTKLDASKLTMIFRENPEYFSKIADKPKHSQLHLQIPTNVRMQMTALIQSENKNIADRLKQQAQTKDIGLFLEEMGRSKISDEMKKRIFGIDATKEKAIRQIDVLRRNKALSLDVIDALEKMVQTKCINANILSQKSFALIHDESKIAPPPLHTDRDSITYNAPSTKSSDKLRQAQNYEQAQVLHKQCAEEFKQISCMSNDDTKLTIITYVDPNLTPEEQDNPKNHVKYLIKNYDPKKGTGELTDIKFGTNVEHAICAPQKLGDNGAFAIPAIINKKAMFLVNKTQGKMPITLHQLGGDEADKEITHAELLSNTHVANIRSNHDTITRRSSATQILAPRRQNKSPGARGA